MSIIELQKTIFTSLFCSHALQKEYASSSMEYETHIANETQTILCHVLDCDLRYLLSHNDIQIHDKKKHRVLALCNKRATGYPLAYLLGYRYFYDYTFMINEHVLIPRSETELLVEQSLMLVRDTTVQKKIPHCILDCGTGSGCIAISLAATLYKEQQNTWYIAMNDIDKQALTLARENAHNVLAPLSNTNGETGSHTSTVHNNEGSKADILPYVYEDNLLTKVLQKQELASSPPGIIIANLPYVCYHELTLSPLDNEPKIALSDYSIGGSGTIKHFITQTSSLEHNCIILLEFDPLQLDTIMAYFVSSNFTYIQYYKDIQGQVRFLQARNF